MDHGNIEENNLAGRYLDSDLDDATRVAFEEHFADCPECLDRLALAEMFRASSRAGYNRRILKRPQWRWWLLITLISLAVLGGPLLFWAGQRLGVKRVQHTQGLHPASQIRLREGSETAFRIPADGVLVLVLIGISKQPSAADLAIEIGPKGSLETWRLGSVKGETGPDLGVAIGPGMLKAGKYEVVVRSGNQAIKTYAFTAGE